MFEQHRSSLWGMGAGGGGARRDDGLLHNYGHTCRCQGEGAPVVLHYPNATLSYWLRKYEMLTTDGNKHFASVREGKEGKEERATHQISLKSLPKLKVKIAQVLKKAKKDKDKKDKEEAAEKQRGAAAGDAPPPEDKEEGEGEEADEDAAAAVDGIGGKKGTSQGMHDLAAALVANGEQEMAKGLYKQQFCIVDELPCLAASGLLVEINFVRDLILRELGKN